MTDVNVSVDVDPRGPATEWAGRAVSTARFWVVHPVWTVFVLALVVRLAASGLILASGHWPIAPDEPQYLELAKVVASGQPASTWDADWGDSLFAQTATFLLPLSWLIRLFGTHVYLGMMIAAVAGAVTAAVTARLVIEAGLRSMALYAGVLIAVLPSQVLWSSLVLREAPGWAALAVLALLVAVALRSRRLTVLAMLGAAIAADLFALFHLRPYVFVLASWAMVAAVLVGGAARRVVTPVGAVALMVAVPAFCGIGVGGLTLVSTNLPVLSKIQQHLAVGADSAIVKPKPTSAPGAAKSRHTSVDDGGGSAAPRNVIRGAVAVTVRPFPWERPTSSGALLAQIENLLWVVLYGFAAVGIWARRRDRRVIAFPVVFMLGFVIMSSLFEGNVGTAFRHRGQIAWAVVLTAAYGAVELRSRWRAGADDQPAEPPPAGA